MNTEQLIDQLLSESDAAGNFTLESYEVDESYEVENYLVKKGYDRTQARKAAMKVMKRPAAISQIRGEMRANGGQGAISITSGSQNGQRMAAQFDITAKRLTAAIPEVLPVPFFGAMDVNNAFNNILQLPAGVTITGFDIGANKGGVGFANKLSIEYTQGLNVDIVEITSTTYPYPSLLASTITDLLRLSKMRYSISDTTQVAQFNQAMQVVSRSMFGKISSDSISVGAFKSPTQFQAGIIDLDGQFEIDKETSIQTGLIAVAGFSITLSMWVEKFYRQNTKGF